MIRGALSHLDLSVADPERSVPFYDAVLPLLGYRRVATGTAATAAACWHLTDKSNSVFGIALEPARGPGRRRTYDRHSPGLHHVAFHVDSRADVDQLYKSLVEIGAEILDVPAEYDYSPGYYALSFKDPDGLVLEFVYEPQL
ncbi:MAG: VOC family protein [Dehalococcoidia bacterium]